MPSPTSNPIHLPHTDNDRRYRDMVWHRPQQTSSGTSETHDCLDNLMDAVESHPELLKDPVLRPWLQSFSDILSGKAPSPPNRVKYARLLAHYVDSDLEKVETISAHGLDRLRALAAKLKPARPPETLANYIVVRFGVVLGIVLAFVALLVVGTFWFLFFQGLSLLFDWLAS